MKSDNGGYKWKIFLQTLNRSRFMEPTINTDPFDRSILYITSRVGIYKFKDTLTNVDDNEIVNFQYTLHQNYPNPFNSSTTICYAISFGEIITIKIYNILGKEVKHFQVHHKQPGQYQISWDGTDKNGVALPSGVYFFCMQSNNYFDVKKMILLR